MKDPRQSILSELKGTPLQERPHVVVLGAGASHAATPEGERNLRKLPLMRDLADALELNTLLDRESYLRAKNDYEEFFGW